MRQTTVRILSLLFLFIAYKSAVCDNLNRQSPPPKKLIVKGDQYYPPFEYINEKGEPDGFNVALFKKIADELQLDYTIELGPWPIVRKELAERKIDLLLGALVSEERAEYFDFGLPHSMMNFKAYTRKGLEVSDLEDLKDKDVVVQEADLMNDMLPQKDLVKNLILAKDQLEALRMIQAGKYDVALLGSFQAEHLIQKFKFRNVIDNNINIASAPYALATYKGNEELMWKLNAALYSLKENGTYDKLYNKWFQVYEQRDFLDKYGFALLISVLGFLFLLLFLLLLHLRIKVVKSRLTQSENLYRLLVQSQRDVVLNLTKNGTILYASPSFCALVNKKADKLYHSSLSEVINTEAWRSFQHNIQQLSIQNPTANLEQSVFVNHTSLWISWNISIIENQEANEPEVLAVGRDITSHKKAEQKLASSETRLRQLIQNIPNMAVQGYDAQGTVKYWNNASKTLYGYTEDEAIGKKLYELIIFPEDIKKVKAAVAEMISSGHSLPAGELNLKHKDGSTVEVYSSHAVINLLNGERELFCVDVDITDIKRAQLIQKVLFNITNAVHLKTKLEDLLHLITSELSKLMECSHLYIAFYDKEKDVFTSMTENDTVESFPEWPATASLTGKVVKERHSLLIKKDAFNDLVKKGEVKLIGEPSEVWLGVPLFTDDEVFGAVVVQSYTNPDAYDQKSVDLMEFVSQQMSLSIQRQQNLIGLIEAKKKAEESDLLKTAFLNNLSHEIRTPLNGIVGLTAMFDEPYTNPQDRKSFSEMITENSRQLTAIIDNIINAAAIEAGQENVRFKVIDLQAVLNEIVAKYSERNTNNQLEFEADITLEDEFGSFVTDKEKLVKIIDAVLDNAMKFTKEGRVILSCYSADKQVHLLIQDTGIGIASEDQQRIFERFQKVEKQQHTLYRGNGLGLTIAKAYVALLEGEINLISTPDEGTTIHIILPAKLDNKSFFKEKTMDKNLPNKRKIKILIVEDEYTNMFFLRSAFKGKNFELITAGNGQKAVSLFEQSTGFDLVLMDLKLPLMNGFQAAEKIKKIQPDIPIIAVTAYALRGDKEKAFAAGCDDYIAKPFLKIELINVISKYVNLQID